MPYTFEEFRSNTSNLTTYSFTGVSIGAASADRRVVVCCMWSASSSRAFSSGSIAGVGATLHIERAPGFFAKCAIMSANVSTGTTADISFTLSGSALRGGIGVYAVYGLVSSTPHATAESNTSLTINVPANGLLISCGIANSTGAVTWTGANEDYDSAIESAVQMTGASIDKLETETGRTVSATLGGSNPGMCAATWQVSASLVYNPHHVQLQHLMVR